MYGLLRGLVNLLRLPVWPLWWLGRLLGRPRGEWVVVRLHARLTELERPRSRLFRWFPALARLMPTPLEVLRRLADEVGRDARVRGVVFVVPRLMSGWAACKGVRDVVAQLRGEGKEVVSFLQRGGSHHELYVASAADRIYVAPEATLMALGLAVEARYLKPLLDRAGVEVQAFARSEFKTAAEFAVRDTMSEPQREQLEALLGTLDRELVSALAARPGMDEERARGLFARGFIRGTDAVEAGIADGVCYEDELPARLGSAEEPVRLMRAPRYLAFKRARFFRRMWPAPYIGVVSIHGAIMEDADGPATRVAELEPIVNALRTARADRRAWGVILHVSSPGGSAMASDLIHREVERLRECKPVVACFGEVAASGGYYVAAPAHAIVAQPVCVTGSIGVLAAKVVARRLLDSLGVRTETVRTSPHADMFGVHRDLDDDERAIMNGELDAFYRGFVEIVARGRGRTPEEIDRVGRGRVWTGADAAGHGLVDRLGGFDVALQEVRARIAAPQRVLDKLAAREIRPRSHEMEPPEPPRPRGAREAVTLLETLEPEAARLLQLASGPDPVLYYAPALPVAR